ncbi:hypothetical protein HO173_001768 [Letharia columbiana]|uniref:Myb-like domain-containing protein n=1 Tax=Letharia columbiana TaxID=112416 RepID=A0A8H6G432_9LECA|nr:uncharacterized protein HO173_001768 [Letharia columbiana]KAF6240158.1 hypothetical protein HO173_001768 [Letharia columbiana]
MEPPFKRRRFSGNSYPEIDLHARRAQNDFRLKSIFESIFDKYGKDFDGIGDEIDMATGEIVVDNGHILGMTNERDAGDAEYSSEEVADDEDDHSLIEYREEHFAALKSSKAGDTAAMEESEASGQSDFDADSLMGDVPAESHLHQLGKKSRRAVSIPSDDDEDELASSDIEWASHRNNRLSAQETSCLLKDKPAFADEPNIEPAWRAPPLPNIAILKRERDKVGLTSVDNMREYSDDERAGISLWTPEAKKPPRRRRDSANSVSQRSLSFARGQENSADEPVFDLSNSEPAARRIVKWTQEEEELLIHLKTTTNLSGAAMESYFPERQRSSIASHWTYMITHGKASSKRQLPKILGRRIPLPSLSPNINSLGPDKIRPEPYDHDTFSRAKKPQNVQQQSNKGFLEEGNFVRSLSKPMEQLGDHRMTSQYQTGRNHGKPIGYTVDEPILISDDGGAHIRYTMGEPFSSVRDREIKENFTVGESLDESLDDASEPSARTSDHHHPVGKVHNRSDQSSIYRNQEGTRRTKSINSPEASARRTSDIARHVDGGCKIAEFASQSNPNETYAGTDQSYSLSKPFEIEDDVVVLPDQGLEVVSEDGCEARVSSPTKSIKAKPNVEGADKYSEGFFPPKVQPRSTMAMETSSFLQRLRTSQSASQQEGSISEAKNNIQKKRSTTEGPQKTGPTNLFSISSAQPPNHGKPSEYHEPNFEATSKTTAKRQIVQVVIPLSATSNVNRKSGDTKESPLSHPQIKSPLPTTETTDRAFIRRLSARVENAPAELCPGLPDHEILAIRTPTKSPSVAAAESQYAASAAFVLNDVRSSLGPEIADSQPLSVTPAVATSVQELGREATKPIILDTESQSLRMTPGAATSTRKQPKNVIQSINLDPDSQPLRVTPGVATPVRKQIEEAIESDIVESGSHPLSKRLAAARSTLRKVKKEIVSDSFSSIWTAVDDFSEDELSYL